MPLDDADKKIVAELLAAALGPLAAKVTPEEIGKVVAAHVAEAKKGLVTADDLAKREADAKKAAEDAAKADADRKAAADADKGKADVKDPALAALEARIAELQKANEAATAAANAEREKARLTRLRSEARAAATKHGGVPEDRVDDLVDLLAARGLLTYDGDTPGFKGKSDVGLDAVLPFDKALPKYLAEHGKHYLPPVGTGGTGEGRGNGGGNGGPDNGTASLDSLRGLAGGFALGAVKSIT